LATPFVGYKGVANLQNLPFGAVKLGDHARSWAGYFHKGFIGLHLREDVMLVDPVPGLHTPLDQFRFVNPLPKIREDEVVRVA